MRAFISTTVLITIVCCFSSSGGAQTGQIIVYSDTSSTTNWPGPCAIFAGHGEYIEIYVVHDNAHGVKGSSFKLGEMSGLILIYTYESSQFAKTGDASTGVTIDYGGCSSGSFLILSVVYGIFDAPTCSSLDVLPHQNSATGNVEIINCADNVVAGEWYGVIFNPHDPCDPWCWGIAPVHETSWGRVKALYE